MSSVNSVTTFSGPFKRAELLLLPQYAASNDFLAAGKWTGAKNHVLSLNTASGEGMQTMEPLYCIVVGTVSANKTYLGKHGDFTPRFNEAARKAKLQFTLTRPDDPEFGPDYDRAILAFEKHQSHVSVTALQQYFLSRNEGNAMRMNYCLFNPKGDKSDKERERETLAYSFDHEYEPYWTSANANYSCIMPVYDTNDAPVNPGHFATKLIGATCEVTFTLKHFPISGHKNADGVWVEANDVFSAHVETVAILHKPPVLARSPYKGWLNRRPNHKPQLPTRGEQLNAARAFVPKPAIAARLSPSPFGADAVPVESTSSSTTVLTGVRVDPSVVISEVLYPGDAVNSKVNKPATGADLSLEVPAISVTTRTAAVDTAGETRVTGPSVFVTTPVSDNTKKADHPTKKRKLDK